MPATLGGYNKDHQLTIDFTTDVPCIAQNFIRNHAILRHTRVLPIPKGAISLRSADSSTLKILGYIRFVFTLGNKSLPVESLVLPHLSAEAMLIDDSIMKEVFGAKLDWAAERLSFSDSNVTVPAIHTRKPIRSKNCSVITQNFDTATPVLVRNK